MPKLINRGKGDAEEREGETLKELIMGASDVNFNMGATKQKGAVMPREFGGPNRQGVKATFLIICSGAIKDRDRSKGGRALLKGAEVALERGGLNRRPAKKKTSIWDREI